MAQPNVPDDVAGEILGLEAERYRAVVDGEYETVLGLCHPDLVYTHSDGSRDSVESYLDKCRAGHYVYHRIDHPVEQVVVAGDTAVVVGQMNATITARGKRKELVNNSIAVWVRQDGTWRLLAYQPTPRPAAD
jgi:uncharacterized protein (TIGR02246 family)